MTKTVTVYYYSCIMGVGSIWKLGEPAVSRAMASAWSVSL